MKFLEVRTTMAKRTHANAIANTLITRKLAACAQVVGPITSTYRWKGRVERVKEFLVLAKVRNNRFGAVEKAIRSMHEYEVPEFVAVSLVRVSALYQRWLEQSTA